MPPTTPPDPEIDPTSRPFSPSPPRENRHTASRPPSLILGASLAGAFTSSTNNFLIGLPTTPTGTQSFATPFGAFESDSPVASGEFTHGKSSSPYSGRSRTRNRRNSDSSTSSSSPPLGATSLLASLAEHPVSPLSHRPGPYDESYKHGHRKSESAVSQTDLPATPNSTRSVASSRSANSISSSGFKSLPRLHQPTVIRQAAGRGIAFLPPPAQISASNSTFVIHQPQPSRPTSIKSASVRHRAGSHDSGIVDDLRGLPEGDQGHARHASLMGHTVAQNYRSLVETLPENAHGRDDLESVANSSQEDVGADHSQVVEAELNEVDQVKPPIRDSFIDETFVSLEAPLVAQEPDKQQSLETSTMEEAQFELKDAPSEDNAELSLHEVSPTKPQHNARRETLLVAVDAPESFGSRDEPALMEAKEDLVAPDRKLAEAVLIDEPAIQPPQSLETSIDSSDLSIGREVTMSLPYQPRAGAPVYLESTTDGHTLPQQPSALSFYAALSRPSDPLPQLANNRVELTVAWVDPSTFRWVPGRRLIPSWNVKVVIGPSSHPVVIDPRGLVRAVVHRIPLVWRLADWL